MAINLMKIQYVKYAVLGLVIVAFGACTPAGDWPKLTDPVAQPAQAPEGEVAQGTTNASISPSSADDIRVIEETRESFAQLLAEYHEVFQTITKASRDNKKHRWNAAQIALTRISNITDQLNSLVYAGNAAAIRLDSEILATLRAEQADLDAVKP